LLVEPAKGLLRYDQDGSDDIHTAVRIAKLDAGLGIVAGNFVGDNHGPA
jgi:hypothetical protein